MVTPKLSPFFAQAREQFNQLVETLSSEASQGWEHGELERHLHRNGTEVLRCLFQGHLDLRYEQETYETEVVGSDGAQRPHRRKQTQRQLETLFGCGSFKVMY